MKKVLFATTALVATAGVAAADVTFGGYGRFGIIHVEGAPNETTITSRFRLQIDATAESDSGIVFGARARIQQDNDGIAGDANLVGEDASSISGIYRSDRFENGINGVRFFARSGGLEVGVGNIFGAIDSMPGMYPVELGLTGLSYDYILNGAGAFSSTYDSDGNGAAGRNGVEIMYSMGDLSAHLSYQELDTVPGNGIMDGDRIEGYIAYTFSGWTVALGLQDSDIASDTELALTVGGSVGIADLTFGYADNGTQGDAFAITAAFDVGAATRVTVVVLDQENYADTVYGVGVNHDLGGGTSIRGGIQNNNAGNTVADLGVRFNF
ncbi:porin [Pseudosulfitobacter pseudonitzschiae]|uniref:porin n=1 Tax=Pseudosulfitobacter pseudonitzschiae TaxID=1402135 RepID=UPI001AFAA490|nr:porin [Pseudosulfitobacter pseudonitzschiae]MBM1815837.1 porin [Pseudosulfitobacter pseudonitzschiae]MBM1832828.1 porin [Pseudosulfitobacter pseudonitzschiae]MBM1837696.1 porin [Pseudosulfitobacter pseudonitzschiae]MBM1842542.1 porin [Pseudosulfitobacter pseudonitzschiae]MBM1847410.1 porin [Pseudosulfitobacter pseudonitzschiae]